MKYIFFYKQGDKSDTIGEPEDLTRQAQLNQAKEDECNNLKIIQTSANSSFESQFEEFCRGVGSQPCTCYYPDHGDVTLFELSSDDVTKNATERANGTGPASCEDLRKIGHSLNGFYTIRFNLKRVKAIFCVFNNNKMIEKCFEPNFT